LVHEAYLRLAGEQDRDWESRKHFFAVAAQIMRNLLVDHARAQSRGKRGGGCQHVILDEVPTLLMPDAEQLLALDEALARLSTVDPRASRVVELRYFVGLSVEEAAAVMGVSEKTVKRDWNLAKSWLQAEMRPRT
jgi:RNA polymerase sigma factor (TIGR02999 family)